MKKGLSLSLLCLALSTALPALAAGSFVGSDKDPSHNTVTGDITIDAKGLLTYGSKPETYEYALFGIFPSGQSVAFTGQNITVNVKAKGKIHKDSQKSLQGVGVDALGGSKVVLGGADSKIEFNIDSDNMIMAIRSATGSSVEINGQELRINAESFGTTEDLGSVYGLYAQNITADPNVPESDRASLIVNAENTYVNVKSAAKGHAGALVAMSQGILKVNGNLYASGDDAIVARGGSIVRINESNTKTVQLNGDVDFNYDKKTSGTSVDSDVLINLSGADSFWRGSATSSYGSGATTEDMMKVSGLKLGLSDGAQWTPRLVDEASGTTSGVAQIAINDLAFNDGVINLDHGGQQTVRIEKLHGTGGTVNLSTTAGEDGTFTTANLQISDVVESEAPNLTVNYTGITADDMVGHAIADIQGGVEATGATQTRVVAQGDVMGAITEKTDAQGQVIETTQAENTKLSAFGSVAALSAFQWRHDMNDLTKRMGELRTSPEGIGSWVRLYGSEQEYGALQAKNTSIQVGSDVDVGMGWKVGAAFSYTDGNATYADGDADNKAYGLGIYGTWMAENGQFVDLIAKYSRLDTDFALNGMNGGFDNNAYSVSAEYGWHLKLGEYAFVEPQAELTYGQVLGDTFTTGNGVKVEQDDFDAFIGRIGVRGGFHFPDNKGVVYVRASVLHDFEGESTAVASLVNDSSVRSGIHEDLGGTWYEVGVGANFNVTDNTYTYVDLEKTSGGEVKENWRWNIGLRHVF